VGHIYNDASIHYSISFTSPKGEGFQPSPRETLRIILNYPPKKPLTSSKTHVDFYVEAISKPPSYILNYHIILSAIIEQAQ